MIYYVAATDCMSWGRGAYAWEAVGHALQHSGRKATKVVLFEVDSPREGDVYVNDMGNIVAPKGSKFRELATISLHRLSPKFYSFFDELEAMLE
jgi:hypothetical protein